MHPLQRVQDVNVKLLTGSLSAGLYVDDIADTLDAAALPRDLIQVNGVNFIKLLLQSAVS